MTKARAGISAMPAVRIRGAMAQARDAPQSHFLLPVCAYATPQRMKYETAVANGISDRIVWV